MRRQAEPAASWFDQRMWGLAGVVAGAAGAVVAGTASLAGGVERRTGGGTLNAQAGDKGVDHKGILELVTGILAGSLGSEGDGVAAGVSQGGAQGVGLDLDQRLRIRLFHHFTSSRYWLISVFLMRVNS